MKPKSNSGVFNFFTRKLNIKRTGLYATPIFLSGLFVTVFFTLFIYNTVEIQERRVFFTESREIYQQLVMRLESHALMLRAGASFFMMSDTVTRSNWEEYVLKTRIYRYLPDVQGLGYAVVIPADRLQEHIQNVKNEGFSEYTISPGYERDLYTAILYVDPFTGRNRIAIGYDMFTDPIHRKAMEISRDYDVAALTGRIKLNNDTGGEEIYGTIMFVPVYDNQASAETTEERREAIRGWLYSPYRIKTLMDDLLESFYTESEFRVQLYNERVSDENLLYDSHGIGSEIKKGFGTVESRIPLGFNTNVWHLYFFRPGVIPLRAMITFITGLIISLLLYFLALVFSKIAVRSAQIRLQNEELGILNATKDKFFSIIAHDLKSPYNAVLGFSEILTQQADQINRQEIARISEIIKKSASQANDLLKNLMEWASSQTGRISFKPEETEVEELFKEVKLLFSGLAYQKGIEIRTSLPEGLRAYVDRAMARTILRNLVSNAIKFTDKGGKVIIEAEQKENELLIKVSDTGVGIPAIYLNKLFRIDESYTTSGTQNEKGTGLGLILCREFVEKHGGRIWAESKTGDDHGSAFFFTIPLIGKFESDSREDTVNWAL